MKEKNRKMISYLFWVLFLIINIHYAYSDDCGNDATWVNFRVNNNTPVSIQVPSVGYTNSHCIYAQHYRIYDVKGTDITATNTIPPRGHIILSAQIGVHKAGSTDGKLFEHAYASFNLTATCPQTGQAVTIDAGYTANPAGDQLGSYGPYVLHWFAVNNNPWCYGDSCGGSVAPASGASTYNNCFSVNAYYDALDSSFGDNGYGYYEEKNFWSGKYYGWNSLQDPSNPHFVADITLNLPLKVVQFQLPADATVYQYGDDSFQPRSSTVDWSPPPYGEAEYLNLGPYIIGVGYNLPLVTYNAAGAPSCTNQTGCCTPIPVAIDNQPMLKFNNDNYKLPYMFSLSGNAGDKLVAVAICGWNAPEQYTANYNSSTGIFTIKDVPADSIMPSASQNDDTSS